MAILHLSSMAQTLFYLFFDISEHRLDCDQKAGASTKATDCYKTVLAKVLQVSLLSSHLGNAPQHLLQDQGTRPGPYLIEWEES